MSKTFLNEFVHQKGRQFYWTTLPADIPRGKLGDCFDWCLAIAARSNGKYRYCEGMARPMYGTKSKKWIHHAWLSDETGMYAYDPTWRAEKDGKETILPAFYIGAVCDLHTVMEFVTKTGFKSPFANADKDMDAARKVFDFAT